MAASTRNRYTFIVMLAAVLLVVVLIGMNEAGVQQAQELCRGAGGVPEVSRNLFIQPEFHCQGVNFEDH